MNELASRLRAHPSDDLSLAVGGVALGIGSVLAFDRMEASWAAFPLLLLLAVPCGVLFLLALAPGSGSDPVGTRSDGRLAPWQTAFLLIAVPLLAASIIQLTEVLGKESPGTGTATWILVLTGLCALWVSVRLQSPGGTLLAALFFSAATLTAVNWIDSDADVAVYRDVLLIDGLIFLFAAKVLWNERRADSNLLVGVAGATLIAGALLGNEVSVEGFLGLSPSFEGKDGWELVLIVVSIGLLAYAAWQRHGGTAFVGGFGTLAFLVFASNETGLSGWPLVLGIVTVACLAWALAIRPSTSSSGTGAPPPPAQPPPR
ncbi:MAG: hypothetical protein ACRDKV_09900 [Solirubrobacterales bacterium]